MNLCPLGCMIIYVLLYEIVPSFLIYVTNRIENNVTMIEGEMNG